VLRKYDPAIELLTNSPVLLKSIPVKIDANSFSTKQGIIQGWQYVGVGSSSSTYKLGFTPSNCTIAMSLIPGKEHPSVSLSHTRHSKCLVIS